MFHTILEHRLQNAVATVLPGAETTSVLVRPAADPKFGDYQTNALMALARDRKINPRQLAADVVARLDVADLCHPVEIAGPGFLNFRILPAALSRVLGEALRGNHLFFEPSPHPRTVVVDFSSPNVAKPMHVGHIRSTILGDCLARVLRLLGHRVITDNHIGDWGTQFGLLLVGWKSLLDREALERDAIAELERLYRAVNARADQDPSVREEARAELVRLQSGDAANLAIWAEMIRLSKVHFEGVYTRLGVTFDHTLGESFYNPWLRPVVDALVDGGIARESEGAIAIFSDRSGPPKEDPFLIQRDGEWTDNPALVLKSDGGFNYTTTDLATLDYRIRTWAPSEIVYVTDGRQQLHFQQVFAAFRRWKPRDAASVRLAHVWFGSILGDDGKPFKTRSGETVKLGALLDEAEERALAVVREKRPDLAEAAQREIARVVGLGSVKYQDLLPNRQSDYVFSWDKMLALQGNTAPYLQYQYTRAAKVVRDGDFEPASGMGISPVEPAELALARHLVNFGNVLVSVTEEYRPNYLCNYLYELAGYFSGFYEACPVLKSEGAVRSSRLGLCELTARVLGQGLSCLGIEVTAQM
ncbi:MAG: arginine--tRNA ligase [Verrucomicrobia bacterium]|nr:MAG: arginine--tRNA ligase [Verrucomicrobiota bacterium]